MAISRFLADRWPDVRWFPFWLNGVPIENTYLPVLQVIVAMVAKALHCSTALAFHAVVRSIYTNSLKVEGEYHYTPQVICTGLLASLREMPFLSSAVRMRHLTIR